MKTFEERLLEIEQELKERLEAIRDDQHLNDTGKRAATGEVKALALGKLLQLEADMGAELDRLDTVTDDLKKNPPRLDLTETELLRQQHDINNMLSVLAATAKADFLGVVKEQAELDPAAFCQGFHQVKTLADKLFPPTEGGAGYDPWAKDPQGAPAEKNNTAPRVEAELITLYHQAAEAIKTPDQLKHGEQLEALAEKRIDVSGDVNPLRRRIDRLEKELAGTDWNEIIESGSGPAW